jgi:methionyl-tRNA synthetase
MLKASDLEPPKQILAHGWWTSSGAKMSKSTGESVDPLELVDEYGADIFRFFVMREMKVGQDAEFSLERFESRYRADLGNDLGNLVSRLLHMCKNYFDSIVPEQQIEELPETKLREKWEESKKQSLMHFDEFQFSQGLEQVSEFIRAINKYADERLPWKLAKSSEDKDQKDLQTCISTMVEALRLANSLLVAVMPEIHAKINDRLSLEATKLWETDLNWDNRLNGQQLKEKIILFPRK